MKKHHINILTINGKDQFRPIADYLQFDKIIGCEFDFKLGVWRFLVLWHDFPTGQATWELLLGEKYKKIRLIAIK